MPRSRTARVDRLRGVGGHAGEAPVDVLLGLAHQARGHAPVREIQHATVVAQLLACGQRVAGRQGEGLKRQKPRTSGASMKWS